MVLSKLALSGALLLLCSTNTAVVGFTPSSPLFSTSSSNSIGRCNSPSNIMATIDKKDSMTESDEDILFGSSGSESSTPNPPFRSRQRYKSRTGNLLVDRTQPMNPLDHSPNDPLINRLRTVRETLPSCPAIWSSLAKLCPDHTALVDEHLSDTEINLTFKEMDDTVRRSAAAFQRLGVGKGDNVAILGENSARWLMADHGIQLAGGASAVRGAEAPFDELSYIYNHSDSKAIAVLQGPKLLQRLIKDAKAHNLSGVGLTNEMHGDVKTIILLNLEKKTEDQIKSIVETSIPDSGITVHTLASLIRNTEPASDYDLPPLEREDLSTIVYTSGTTGKPKGVMLSHGNLLHQVGHRLAPTKLYDGTEPVPGDTMLSLLPVWHITERTFELWMFTRGSKVVYSSIRTFKNDLAKYKPEWMVLVPRVLEKVATGVQNKFASGSAVAKTLVKVFTLTGTAKNKHSQIVQGLVVGDTPPGLISKIRSRAVLTALLPLNLLGNKLVWSKVQAGFGGNQKAIISGGSALSGALEAFYQTSGIPIMVGYGLTECSPLISHRRSDQNLVTAGCVGHPCLDTELRVVDPDIKAGGDYEREALPDGTAGVVLGRGPQVMRGYYKNVEATDKAIDRFGWFDTGDLGRVNPATGDLILTGRCKDTIVLSNGENIEPSPIEDAILSSESGVIEQVMLTGQDGRSLIAIVVLKPTELVSMGFLDESSGKRLQKLSDAVNDPACSAEDLQTASAELGEACASKLRGNEKLKKALKGDMSKATSNFRPWEQVGDVYVTLEPFAMANQLLTQSYKVKRDSVLARYGEFL